MRDLIELKGIRVFTTIGVLPHEHQHPQPVEVDLALEIDASTAGKTDQLNDSTDYAEAVTVVHRTLTAKHHRLLEHAASRIADELLELARVTAVDVVVRKTHVSVPYDIESAGVRLRRTCTTTVPSRRTAQAFVALGSNLGDRAAHLRHAVRRLDVVTARSSVYETDPVGGPEGQGPFLNMVVAVETKLNPFELLEHCLAVEREAGRERRERWGPRTLDLDLLLYDDVEIRSPELTLPHPRMWERRFVLQPLADIAPHRLPEDWDARLSPEGIRRIDDLDI